LYARSISFSLAYQSMFRFLNIYKLMSRLCNIFINMSSSQLRKSAVATTSRFRGTLLRCHGAIPPVVTPSAWGNTGPRFLKPSPIASSVLVMELYRKFMSRKTGAASTFCHPADQSKMWRAKIRAAVLGVTTWSAVFSMRAGQSNAVAKDLKG